MQTIPLRQVFYHSRAVGQIDVSPILSAAKRNNGMDGITGLLLFDGRNFLQVLEGPEDSVQALLARIMADKRHVDMVVISDQAVDEREFAYWSMELREPGHPSDDAMWRLRRRLEQFNPELRHFFFDGAESHATALNFSGH